MIAAPLPQLASLTPCRPSNRRKGKIARLPKETRDKINRMLDDGVPYTAIIRELGPAGAGLNLQNITNWRQGGYHEWVTSQEQTERTKAHTEHAIGFLRETGEVDANAIVQAGQVVGAAQLMEAMMDRGDGALKRMLVENPDAYIRMLNLVCRMSGSALRCQKQRDLERRAQMSLKPNQP